MSPRVEEGDRSSTSTSPIRRREACCFTFRAALACLTFITTLAHAADPDDIPVIGRPVEFPFSDASAGFVRQGDELLCPFRVEPSIAPAHVEVEQPLTFSVDIHARGPVRRPPVRLDLRELPAFQRGFHIEDVTDGQKDQLSPTRWRWVYRLKPKRAGLDEVPRLPFVFYNHDLRPAEKAFQVIWTDPLPITVRPAEPAEPPPVSDRIKHLATGRAVLADAPAWSAPGSALLTTTLALPPAICALWYLVWRRKYPDAARLAHQRRSRAARRALASLDAARQLSGKPQAEAVTGAIVGYLRERFDLPIAEPTPDEAAAWLTQHGRESASLKRVLSECAAERFGPEATAAPIDEVRRVILALEEPTCSPS